MAVKKSRPIQKTRWETSKKMMTPLENGVPVKFFTIINDPVIIRPAIMLAAATPARGWVFFW